MGVKARIPSAVLLLPAALSGTLALSTLTSPGGTVAPRRISGGTSCASFVPGPGPRRSTGTTVSGARGESIMDVEDEGGGRQGGGAGP